MIFIKLNYQYWRTGRVYMFPLDYTRVDPGEFTITQ